MAGQCAPVTLIRSPDTIAVRGGPSSGCGEFSSCLSQSLGHPARGIESSGLLSSPSGIARHPAGHSAIVTTAAGAVVLCVAAVMTIEWSPKRSVRIISSVAITLLLFVPLVALLVGFWVLYAAVLDHAGL